MILGQTPVELRSKDTIFKIGLASSAGRNNTVITTSTSLLARLRTGEETQAWDRFVRLYTPVLYYWVRRQGVPSDDSADLVQEVFAVLVKQLPTLHYNPQHDLIHKAVGWMLREVQPRQADSCEVPQKPLRSHATDDVTLRDREVPRTGTKAISQRSGVR